MFSSTRTLTACALALTAAVASPLAAQSTDTTRAARPPMGEGMMGPRAEMRARMLERMRADDDFRPRRGEMRRDGGRSGMRGDMQRGFRGGRGGAPGRGVGMRGPGGARALLRGITLSADQEKALRTNQARHLLATKPLMLEMMSARTDEQLARLNGDQKALDAASTRLTATRARLDSLREGRSPVSDLRAVLTPDQQKLLDRNLASPDRPDRAGAARRAPMGARGMRDGMAPGPRRGGERPTGQQPDSLDDSASNPGDR